MRSVRLKTTTVVEVRLGVIAFWIFFLFKCITAFADRSDALQHDAEVQHSLASQSSISRHIPVKPIHRIKRKAPRDEIFSTASTF